MMDTQLCAMRNVLIAEIFDRMGDNERIFFLSADFGAPSLDRMRERFPGRFASVGIAEQNLIGIAAGLALEGFTVYAYGIAPFLSMRDFEQIRVQLSLLAQSRAVNVNLISVGAGVSYDVSGPTHHCVEDISIIRTLPNITLFSPSDWVQVKQFVDYSIRTPRPKYLRLDGKVVGPLCPEDETIDFDRGFREQVRGERVVLVTTGFATQMAVRIAAASAERKRPIGVVDVFMLKPLDVKALVRLLGRYEAVITIEEGFRGKGGLDSLILTALNDADVKVRVATLGFSDTYYFDNGGREYLHQLYGISTEHICRAIDRFY